MSLEGAKIICLNDGAPDQNEIISAQGKTFKFGYYMDCDVVLEHPDAIGLHCTIDCDAFGRVTIENRCPDQMVTLNGDILKKMRPLLNNTEICIFDKKFLWQFEGNSKSGGFQMEDIGDFTTPCKEVKKAEQPPNSEPARSWKTQFHKRLTIHSFAYCIKANESPKDVELTTDENKPLNTYERIIPVESETPATVKRLSPSPLPIAADLIDLKTPKARQRSLAGQRTPLSCCKLSETVITSYSPRETGVRPDKSFAIVQSPAAMSAKSTFQQLPSPLTVSHRPSMHLIDLTTPKKHVPHQPFSPARTLLKSTLKKNIPSTSAKLQQRRSIAETTTTSMESVYSVPSTDEESVIELSDEGSFSPSPVPKTPLRKTPQSLMKHAIISSAKKAAITKRLQLGAKQTPSRLMLTSPGASGVRFQSQSTPQRKSLGRLQSPSDGHKASQSVAGKTVKSMFTSTPFRASESTASRRSILRTPSTSLTSVKNKSRTSLMLKHALSKSPQSSSAKKRKSVSFIEATKSPAIRVRKSVSFLDRIESEGNQSLNQTFSIDEEKEDLPKKDATFSPEKEKFPSSQETNESKGVCPSLPIIVITKEKSVFSSPKIEVPFVSDVAKNAEVANSPENNSECLISHSALQAADSTNVFEPSALQTPQSSRVRSKEGKTSLTMCASSASTEKLLSNIDMMEDDDFEGLDAIFKTPKAKNLMILGSPKSISLQKPTSDSVELIHSTEFDLSANLDDIFRTPQSEFITNRVEGESTPANVENMEPYSPEEAFDLLVGRPIIRKTYTNKVTPPKQDLPPLNDPRDNSLPKTDIEEWIDNVHDSIQLLGEDDDDEDEMSYLTATQNEFSRDPLMTSSIPGSVSITNKKKRVRSPKDESAMTIQEDAEGEELAKDPLEMTAMASPNKPRSPNISGIDLLDHTSESLFSETLEISGDSSGKESDKTIERVDDVRGDVVSQADQCINISPDKARREMEEAFRNFEKERKMLEDKRLVSTPEPMKPVAQVNRRKTMGNQKTLHAYFDVKLLKEEPDLEIAFKNFKEEPTTVGPRLSMTPEVNRAVSNEMRKTLGNPVEGEFVVNAVKAQREMELAFENFNEEPGYTKNRAVQTPEPGKAHFNDHRRTMGTGLVTKVTLDLKAVKAERDTELAFENFEEKPQYSGERSAKTPEPKKVALKDHRRTMGSNLVSEVTLDLETAKAQLEMEQAFKNFEDQPEFSQERAAQTPEPKKAAIKDHRRTMGSNLQSEVTLDLEEAKAQLDMEQAFKNFEDQPEFSQERAAQTPKPKKPSLKDHRRTMGSNLQSEVTLDLEKAKAQLEMEQAFQNFEDEPEFSEERAAQTPEPKKAAIKDHRRTMGSNLQSEVTLDLEEAKAQLDMEQAFKNFEDQPEFSQERAAQKPEPKKPSLKDHRRTMGSNLQSEVTLDLEEAKAQLEMEQAFQNFEDEPEFSEERAAQTPEPKKAAIKDHRRTMGSNLQSEVTLDLEEAKAQLEMEQAFQNFEDEPEFSEERAAQTPEPKKAAIKDHRRTMGSNLQSEVTLDLEEAKAQLDMEQAFKNFEDQPEFSQERAAQTPEPKKPSLKDHRRTMGSNLQSEVTLDLEEAKTQLEMEQAFQNFEDEPEFSEERAAQTPEPKKAALKDHRRTMGSNLQSEVTLNLEEAKAQLEMEQAFKIFENQPEFSQERAAQTPEPKKAASKDRRRTLGSNLVLEVTLDLEEAKAQLEMEQAFKNFEDQPEFSQERAAQTPEPKKPSLKDHRRRMGSNLQSEVTLDLEEAKAQLEMEQAFQNFEDEPEFSEERAAQTPEPKKAALKDHRRTMGSNLQSEVTLNLEEAKAQLEMEQAFKNFEDQPEFSQERAAQMPEPKKAASKDRRRTLGSNLVSEVTLDLEEAKAQLEMEQAFKNFENQPEFSQERAAQTPEPKKAASKDHRRTMGSNLQSEVTLDLEEAKAQLEMEQAFQNFEDEPEFSEERAAQTPEPKKAALKDNRRTMGSNLQSEVTLDLEKAKAELEMEQAFKNFEDKPQFSQERTVQTPELRKATLKDHRRTMGSNLVSQVTLDLEAAKAELEMEQVFKNFEDQPEFSQNRAAQTPEPKKPSLNDHRRTMGSNLQSEVTLDLEKAKAELEMEQAFKNFEDKPQFSQERTVQTPELKKATLTDHRRTMGSNLVSQVTLDLEAAKAELEMEQAFKNFEDQPEFSQERAAQTPEPKKPSLNDHRRTMGSNLQSEVTLDLDKAKAELEMEQAFKNFEDKPQFSQERTVQTPELKKATLKDHRRTMGSNLVSQVTLDLEAAKAELEMELAFENFEDEPEFFQERAAQTPEPKKAALSDHRRTMGSNLVSEVTLDLKAAKAQLEMQLAFKDFEDEPGFSEERAAQTPQPKKPSLKDHRRTMGSNLLSEVTLDIKAAKAQLEMEQAFENFEDEPEFSQERAAQTPEPKKPSLKDHRRTMGSNLVSEVTLDLEKAKTQLEFEHAFENFEDEPEFSEERAAQTPEPKKPSLKDHRRTMGSNLVSEVTLDLEEAKAQLEMEQAFKNFEDEPEFSEERAAQTPEQKKPSMKDNRRTMGSNLLSEVTLDLEAAKAQLEMDKAFENFEKHPTVERKKGIRTPEPKKRMRSMRMSLGYRNQIDHSFDIHALKSPQKEEQLQSIEVFALQPSIRKENEGLPPVMEISDDDEACETAVAVSDSDESPATDQLRSEAHQKELATESKAGSMRKSQQSMDEENKCKQEVISQVSLDEHVSIQPRTRRRRQNTIDEVQEAKSNFTTDTEDIATAPSQPKSRRRRQPTIDDVEQLKQKVEIPQTRTRRGRQHSVDVGFSLKDEQSHRLHEQEAAPPSMIPVTNDPTPKQTQTVIEIDTPLKRDEVHSPSQTNQSTSVLCKLQKKSTSEDDLDSLPVVAADSEIHNQLEPIAEENKLVASQLDDAEAESEKSVLNLNAEVDEISSTPNNSSSNRIRGRTAQLSVVLVESKNNGSPSVRQYVDEIKVEADEKSEPTAIRNDADEVIPCTPAPIKTRGRRPAHKVDSADVAAPVVRRGRRGSVQQDVDLKVVEQVVSTTPVPTKLRGRKAHLKMDSADGSSSPAVDLIPPTPETTKPRGRRAALKVESNKTTAKDSTPSRNRGRQGKDAIHTDQAIVAPVKAETEEEDRRRSINDTEVDMDIAAEVPTVPLSVEAAPVRKRGRKKAASDPDVHTALADVAPTGSLTEKRYQLQSIDDADSQKNEAPVPLTVEKAPVRKRGRKEAVADPDVPTEEVAVAPTGSIAEERSQVQSVDDADTHINEVPATQTVENAPVRKRGRKKANPDPEVPTEEVAVAPPGSIVEEQSQMQSADDADTPINEVPAPQTVENAPVRKRGRKKANPDPEVPTEEVAVAPRGYIAEERSQMQSVDDADTHINEAAVHLAVENAPVRKRGRKKAVADPDLTDQANVPPTESLAENITSQFKRSRRSDAKVAVAPLESSIEEKDQRKSDEDVGATSETCAPLTENSATPLKRGRRGIIADRNDLIVEGPETIINTMTESTAPAIETEHAANICDLVESAVKASAPASKRGRKRGVQGPNTNTEAPSAVPTEAVPENLSQTRRASRKLDVSHSSSLKIEPISPSAGTSEPLNSTTKDSNPVDEDVPSNPEPPKKRGRKPKLPVSVSDALTPYFPQSTQMPLKTRGRRGALKSESVDTDAESLTPSQKAGRKGAIEKTQVSAIKVKEEVDDSAIDDTVQQDQTDSEEVVVSTPVVPSKKRGRRPALKAETTRPASSTPVRGRGRRGTADVLTEEPVVPVKIEPTTESGTVGQKGGRKGADKEEIVVEAKAAHAGRQRGRRAIVEPELLTKDNDVEKATPKQQRQQEASTLEPSEPLTESGSNDDIPAAEQAVLSKKRGRPAAVKSEPTPEIATPVRKRGRKAAAKQEVHPTETAEAQATGVPDESLDLEEPKSSKLEPPRVRRLPAKLIESAAESITPRQRRARKPISKCEEESTDFDQTPVKPEVKLQTRPIRNRRASVKEVSEEEAIASAEEKLPPVSEESEKKPTRGRKAQPKKDATIDSTTSHTEEEQPPDPIKTKATRGRKPTVKANTSSTKEKPQIEDTKPKRGRKPNPVEVKTEDEVEGTPEPTKKTTRSKTGVGGNQPTKKTVRGRKATARESDDEHSSQADTPINPTRSRKVAQPVAKRPAQRIVEIISEDDQEYTPSKRIRRKPNILLSDEFVH